jgi:hypothetical protein
MGNTEHRRQWQPTQPETPRGKRWHSFFIGDWAKVLTIVVSVLGAAYAFAQRVDKIEWQVTAHSESIRRIEAMQAQLADNQTEVIRTLSGINELMKYHLSQKP